MWYHHITSVSVRLQRRESPHEWETRQSKQAPTEMLILGMGFITIKEYMSSWTSVRFSWFVLLKLLMNTEPQFSWIAGREMLVVRNVNLGLLSLSSFSQSAKTLLPKSCAKYSVSLSFSIHREELIRVALFRPSHFTLLCCINYIVLLNFSLFCPTRVLFFSSLAPLATSLSA